MARTIFTILCRKASVEAQTNVLSLFEIIEEMTIALTAPPATGDAPQAVRELIQIEASCVSLWEREDPSVAERVDTRFRILDPRNEMLGEAALVVDLTGHLRARAVATFQWMEYRGPGLYRLVVEQLAGASWTQAGSFPFMVNGPPLAGDEAP